MTMRARDDSAADTLDLAELARAARRGGGFIVAFTLAGVVAAGAVLLAGPRRFEAASSIVVRSSSGARSSLLSKLAGADGAAGLLDGGSSSPLETEIQILSSRELIGRVVDSLHLQVQVRAPSGVAGAPFSGGVEGVAAHRRLRGLQDRWIDGRGSCAHIAGLRRRVVRNDLKPPLRFGAARQPLHVC